MSYVDRHRPAPFGTETIDRAASAVSEFAGKLRRPASPVTALTPAELEDIGLSIADMPASQPGLVARFVAAVRDWDASRRTVAELERLSDAQLTDIGLTRGQIYDLRHARFV